MSTITVDSAYLQRERLELGRSSRIARRGNNPWPTEDESSTEAGALYRRRAYAFARLVMVATAALDALNTGGKVTDKERIEFARAALERELRRANIGPKLLGLSPIAGYLAAVRNSPNITRVRFALSVIQQLPACMDDAA